MANLEDAAGLEEGFNLRTPTNNRSIHPPAKRLSDLSSVVSDSKRLKLFVSNVGSSKQARGSEEMAKLLQGLETQVRELMIEQVKVYLEAIECVASALSDPNLSIDKNLRDELLGQGEDTKRDLEKQLNTLIAGNELDTSVFESYLHQNEQDLKNVERTHRCFGHLKDQIKNRFNVGTNVTKLAEILSCAKSDNGVNI